MKNRLKERLNAGKLAFGAQLRFGSPAIAELFGLAGFDWILIDSEHAPQTPAGIQTQLQAASRTGVTTIVRLGKLDTSLIHLYLDMGADGIVVPFINTAQNAEIAARACRYPPAGTRGFGPSRAADYGLRDDYFMQSNDNVLFLPLIEDAEAIENIDDILAVEGVDTFLIGLCDLSISLGVPLELEHPKLRNAVRTIVEAAQRAGKPAGLGVIGDVFDPGLIEKQVEAGFTFLLISGDEWLLSVAAKKLLNNITHLRG